MKKMVISGIVIAGLMLGGTTLVAANMDNSDSKKETQIVEHVKDNNKVISIDQIKEIVLSQYEGHIEDIDFEQENGVAYYEVEVENGSMDYDLIIDAYTGEILTSGFDDDEGLVHSLDKIISIDEAKKIALSHFSGDIKEIELDEDDGRFAYEIEMKTAHGEVDLTIDALTGKLLKQDIDE